MPGGSSMGRDSERLVGPADGREDPHPSPLRGATFPGSGKDKACAWQGLRAGSRTSFPDPGKLATEGRRLGLSTCSGGGDPRSRMWA